MLSYLIPGSISHFINLKVVSEYKIKIKRDVLYSVGVVVMFKPYFISTDIILFRTEHIKCKLEQF